MTKTIRSIGGGSGAAPTSAPALHIGPDFGQAGEPQEELSLRPTTFTAGYALTEELSLQPTAVTWTQKFNAQHTELHMTGTMTGPPQFETVVTLASSASSALAFTGVSTIIGQLLLANVSWNAATTLTPPAGWTEIRQTTNTVIANGVVLGSFWHITAAADPSSWTFTHAASGAVGGSISAYSGINSATPIGASAGSTGASTAVTVPTVTAPVANTMLVASVGYTNSSNIAFTTGAAYVSRSSWAALVTGSGDNGCVQDHVQMTSGASGTKTINTGLTAGTANVAHHIAISPGTRVLA